MGQHQTDGFSYSGIRTQEGERVIIEAFLRGLFGLPPAKQPEPELPAKFKVEANGITFEFEREDEAVVYEEQESSNLILSRLASYHGLTKQDTIEELIVKADQELRNSLSDKKRDAYLALKLTKPKKSTNRFW
jgi:hypothetical protein